MHGQIAACDNSLLPRYPIYDTYSKCTIAAVTRHEATQLLISFKYIFQYLINRMVRTCEISVPSGGMLKASYRFEMPQEPRYNCCLDACYIWKGSSETAFTPSCICQISRCIETPDPALSARLVTVVDTRVKVWVIMWNCCRLYHIL